MGVCGFFLKWEGCAGWSFRMGGVGEKGLKKA